MSRISGRLIAAARALVGVSQADFAGACGLDVETLCRLEAGGSAWVSSDADVEAVTRGMSHFGVPAAREAALGSGAPIVAVRDLQAQAFDKMRTMPELPIVCTLSPDALRTRREGLLAELLKRSAGHELLPDGIRLRFAPSGETLSSIAGAIEAERHCCRFLRFILTVEPDEGQFVLALTGPQGTREFVAALLDM